MNIDNFIEYVTTRGKNGTPFFQTELGGGDISTEQTKIDELKHLLQSADGLVHSEVVLQKPISHSENSKPQSWHNDGYRRNFLPHITTIECLTPGEHGTGTLIADPKKAFLSLPNDYQEKIRRLEMSFPNVRAGGTYTVRNIIEDDTGHFIPGTTLYRPVGRDIVAPKGYFQGEFDKEKSVDFVGGIARPVADYMEAMDNALVDTVNWTRKGMIAGFDNIALVHRRDDGPYDSSRRMKRFLWDVR